MFPAPPGSKRACSHGPRRESRYPSGKLGKAAKCWDASQFWEHTGELALRSASGRSFWLNMECWDDLVVRQTSSPHHQRHSLPVGIPTQGTSIGNRCLMQVTSTFNGYATSHCIPCCAALILIQVVSPGCLNHRSKKGKAQSAFTELWHLAMGLAQLDFLWSRLELCASKNATHMTPMEVLTGHSIGHCLAWKDALGQCIESKAPEATKPFKNLHLEGFRCRRPRQMAWNVYTKSWPLPQSLSPREKRVFHHLHHLPTTQGHSSHANMTFKSSPGLAACR